MHGTLGEGGVTGLPACWCPFAKVPPEASLPRPRGQVLAGRQQQIQEKMEQNRQAQEEALRVREELIRDLEEAREAARREREENAGLKAARKQELEAQVGAGGAGASWTGGPVHLGRPHFRVTSGDHPAPPGGRCSQLPSQCSI